jgi:hypothetical protein
MKDSVSFDNDNNNNARTAIIFIVNDIPQNSYANRFCSSIWLTGLMFSPREHLAHCVPAQAGGHSER